MHKIANVLDKLPKSVQVETKSLFHEMMQAPDLESAEKAKNRFISTYKTKYPKATKCLEKDWDQLTTFLTIQQSIG